MAHQESGNILNPLQKIILNIFSNSDLRNKFYWTGGTALAHLYLHHRISKDFDFFSDSDFSYNDTLPLINLIKQKTGLRNIEEKRVADRWEFFIHNKNEVRLEFAQYKFPFLKPRKTWRNIKVDSLEDIAANKTMALIDRHEPKDAFDIYYLINKKNFTPRKLLQITEKKFGVQFTLSLFWSQALLGAKNLSELKPLLKGGTVEKIKRIKNVQEYCQRESNNFLRKEIN